MVFLFVVLPPLLCSAIAAKLRTVPKSKTIGSIACQHFSAPPRCNAQLYNTSTNIAFSGNGFAKPAIAKDVMPGYEAAHGAANANDGKYGNGASWIGNRANSWVKIDLGCVTEIRSVRFGRDRTGGYDDRNPGQVSVSIATKHVFPHGNSDDENAEYFMVFNSTGFRGVLAAGYTVEARFTPVRGRFVKLQVQRQGAAIDEIEVTGERCVPGKLEVTAATVTTGRVTCEIFAIAPQCNAQLYDTVENIGYSGNGFAKSAVAKDVVAGYERTHGGEYANDGKYGNGASWIGNSRNSWVKIDLGCITEIRSVRFGRDRTGVYSDRNPGQIAIFVATTDEFAAGNSENDDVEYLKVFASIGFGGNLGEGGTVQAKFAPVMGRYVKLQVQNQGAGIDEVEVAGRHCAPGKLKVGPGTETVGPIRCQNFASAPACNAQVYRTLENIGYSGNGMARPAVAKDVLAGYETTHGGRYGNDGKYGNGASWIGNSRNSWLKIDLGCMTEIRGVRFGRDRTGCYGERNPGQVSVLVARKDVYAGGNSENDEMEYKKVFASVGFSGIVRKGETVEARFPPVIGRYVKLEVEKRGAAIDEVEVFGKPCGVK